MLPPARFAQASFENYYAQTPTQAEGLREARTFVETVRRASGRLPGWLRRRPRVSFKGLYLVGPVGTGKTHLLASIRNALHPDVPCAFLTASELFRVTAPPETFARDLARRYRVVCIDEIELDDPANEARLILTLKALEKRHVLIVATSNVEPEKFLSTAYGGDRFRRFLNEEFRRDYRVVVVGGEDYRRRLSKPGRAWIGSPEDTREVIHHHYDLDTREKLWLGFDELIDRTVETRHTALIQELGEYEALYLEGIDVSSTDDALRLLRVVDDLYLLPDPPVLHFTAGASPEAWFTPERLHGTLEKGIAEKFRRTVSRLNALCEVEEVSAGRGQGSGKAA